MTSKRVQYRVRHNREQMNITVGEYIGRSLDKMRWESGQIEELEGEIGDLRALVIRLVDVVAPLLSVEEVTRLIGEPNRLNEEDRKVVEVAGG